MKPPMKKPTPQTKARKSPAKAPSTAPMPGLAQTSRADEMKWKAQDALSTLKRAHEIERDPELMKHVSHQAGIERDALKKIARKG